MSSSYITGSRGVPNSNWQSSSVGYHEWNIAIACFFFNEEQQGQPVYLQFDTEALQHIGLELGVPAEQAEKAFASAVRNYLDPGTTNAVGYNLGLATKYMARDATPPTFIALLAFCVLAASRMERDDELGVSSANYYRRLNALLGRESEGRPPWFTDTASAWTRLEEWLHKANNGRFGIATAQPLKIAHPYVGFPQSQCLLRAVDRQRLGDFFYWARLQAGDLPSRSWLAQILCAWIDHAQCSFSTTARWRIRNGGDAVLDAIIAMVELELALWSGKLKNRPDSTRRITSSTLHVTVHALQRRVSWYEVSDEDSTALNGAPDWMLQPPATPNDTILIFGGHPIFGQWTERANLVLNEQHMLLVHKNSESLVKELLDRAATSRWRIDNLTGIPSEWRCFRNVEIVRPDAESPLPGLRVQSTASVRLQGGLLLNRDVYLTGFEPNVVIAGADIIQPIRIDDQQLPVHTGGQSVIALSSYNLSPGVHTLTVGDRTRRFISREAHRVLTRAIDIPSIAYFFQRQEQNYQLVAPHAIPVQTQIQMSGILTVHGAMVTGHSLDLPGHLPYTVDVPNGYKGYIILGRQPGEIIEQRYQFVNRQLMLGVRNQITTIKVSFEPLWLITIGQRKKTLTALQPHIPLPSTTDMRDGMELTAWIRAYTRTNYVVRLTPEQDVSWRAYGRKARQMEASSYVV